MLSRLFSRGMQLQVGEQRVALTSPVDIDVLLRSRTGLSSRRVERLGRLDEPALAREAEQLARLQARVENLLRGDAGDGFLVTTDLADVPDDQDWRAILESLRVLGDKAAPYRSVALQRFAEYLATVQAVLRNLRGAGPDRPLAREHNDTLGGPRQQLLFDLDALRDDAPTSHEMARLPKGETVAVHMQPHQSMELILARYRFVVVSGSPFLLVDDAGHDVKLAARKLVIGRSSEADVSLDAGYRAVSRRHLMVETDAQGLLRLTDISSLGTFVPRAHLGKIFH